MSDYLWDKTGAPEEDVAQLENLLGALKHQPRPLEIPAAAMPKTAARPTPRAATAIFSRPRLAIAASLLLTLLAGAWLITRESEPPATKLAKVEQGSAAGGGKQAETEAAVVPHAATRAVDPVDDTAGGAKTPEDKAVAVVAAAAPPEPKTHRPARQSIAKRRKLMPRVRENNFAPREEVVANGGMRWQVERPLTPQQREATEQLMLALRLASAKLNYAQREMQEIGRAGK
jgi:hypothetical protein